MNDDMTLRIGEILSNKCEQTFSLKVETNYVEMTCDESEMFFDVASV
jgi:hypothetical protein